MIIRWAACIALVSGVTLTNATVDAQTVVAPAGITVSASGSAAATADSVQLVLRVAPRNGLASMSSDDVKALSDTFVRVGVDPATMIDPFPASGPWTAASLSGTLIHASPQRLQSALDQISAVAKPLPSLVVQQLFATLTVDDCRAIYSGARHTAISQARAQALDVAGQSGVRLGRPVSITITPSNIGAPPNRTPNSCTSTYIVGGGNPPFSNLPQMFQIRVYSTVTITYAIQ
jgi:uncharacterized protein YggE